LALIRDAVLNALEALDAVAAQASADKVVVSLLGVMKTLVKWSCDETKTDVSCRVESSSLDAAIVDSLRVFTSGLIDTSGTETALEDSVMRNPIGEDGGEGEVEVEVEVEGEQLSRLPLEMIEGVLGRCGYFLSGSSLNVQVAAVQVLMEGLPRLATQRSMLLPMV
jgi:hypothetical protein